jgi:hypothetical protein
MVCTWNTYGLRSVNAHTFNGSCETHAESCDNPKHDFEIDCLGMAWTVPTEDCNYEEWLIPAGVRNCVNTLLRINNLLFNALGYFPETKRISGLIRMGIGCSIVVVTLAIGTPIGGPGPITGRWYGEALKTGIAQIFRGSMEALMPYGSVVNACLDVLGTMINIRAERHFDPSVHPRHHPDPSYWLPFQLLRLV